MSTRPITVIVDADINAILGVAPGASYRAEQRARADARRWADSPNDPGGADGIDDAQALVIRWPRGQKLPDGQNQAAKDAAYEARRAMRETARR